MRLVSKDKSKGDKAKLAIRPQHLILDPKGPLKGKVTLVERLGTETVVELLSKNNTKFRFAAAQNMELSNGDEVGFKIDAKCAHIF